MNAITDTVASRRLRSRSLVPSRVDALKQAHVQHTLLDGDHYRVEERFEFFAATGYWRSLDGKVRGYNVGSLISEVRLDNVSLHVTLPPAIHQSPAAARDSAAIVPPLNSSENDPDIRAEAAAGDLSHLGPSASLLPKVEP